MKHTSRIAFLCVAVILFSSLQFPAPDTRVTRSEEASSSYVSGSFGAVNEEGYALAGENSTQQLWVNPQSGHFYLEDRSDGSRLTDVPANGENDEWAQGIYRMELLSTMIINVINLESSVTNKKNTEAACVRNNGVTVQALENGFRTVYEFSDVGIVIPLVITLETDYLNVRIDTAEIEETNPQYLLGSASVLPYFAAGAPDDDGYIFVPDGSGALMHFNSGRNTSEYYEVFYGRDLTYNLLSKSTQKETILFPVFGIQHTSQTVLAVITEGDTSSTLHAVPAYYNTTYTQVYNEFTLHSEDTFVLDEDSSTAQAVKLYQTDQFDLPLCELRYYLLPDNQSGYVGMAARYRQYLQEEARVESALMGTAPLLDFYGAVRKKESILGLPLTVTKSLSTAEDISAFLTSLADGGQSGYTVRLMSWSKNQLKGRLDSDLSPVKAVGSLADIQDLSATVTDLGGTLYLSAETTLFYRSGSGISSLFDGAKTFSNSPAYQYTFKLSTNLRDKTAQRWLLIRPDKLSTLTDKLLKGMNKTGLTSLSPVNLANQNYGSYGSDLYTRQDTKEATLQALDTLSANGALLLQKPFAYALAYSSGLVNIPTDSSHFDCMDTAVPFASLALSGLRTCYTDPVNLDSNPDRALLYAAESGSVLHYALITGDNTNLIDTTLNTLTSSNVTIWEDRILEAQRSLESVYKAIEDAVFCDHRILADGVTMSVYSNGTRILVNYTDKPFDSEFGTIAANDILVRGGTEQ